MFTMSISLLCGLLFGVFPAVRAGRGDLSLSLRAGGRGSSLARSERYVSDALMIGEIAFSMVLLVGAGLLARAFLKLLETDPGFRPAQAVALQLPIPTYRYGAYEDGGKNLSRQDLYKRLGESAQSLSGVEVAALTLKAPIFQFWNPDDISIDGQPPAIRNGEPAMIKRWGIPTQGLASYQAVSPGYFAALGIPLVRGRFFDGRDHPGAPLSAVVNQALVRKFFPHEDPIGRRIAIDRGTDFLRRMTIVGVVGDALLDGMNEQALPELFAAMPQLPSEDVWIVRRARGDVNSIGSALQNAIHSIDPEIGVVKVATLANAVGDSLWRERFSALLVGLFAALAVLIVSGGLYALVSRAVQRRTQEIGVRLALGASPGRAWNTTGTKWTRWCWRCYG